MTLLAITYAVGVGIIYHRARPLGITRAAAIAAIWPVAAGLCIRDWWRA